jgi:hypothetical protein
VEVQSPPSGKVYREVERQRPMGTPCGMQPLVLPPFKASCVQYKVIGVYIVFLTNDLIWNKSPIQATNKNISGIPMLINKLLTVDLSTII